MDILVFSSKQLSFKFFCQLLYEKNDKNDKNDKSDNYNYI